MILFNEFIREQSLVELPIKGRKYTWSNMQDSPLLEQLDWFFTSVNWTTTFPNTLVMPQCKPISDHTPCVVTIQSSIPKSKVFRFENYWINHHGFFDVVQTSWDKPCYARNSAAKICKKLKNLRYELKKWSKSISRLSLLIENTNWAILMIDNLEERRLLTTPEANCRIILKKHLITLLDYKQQYWKK